MRAPEIILTDSRNLCVDLWFGITLSPELIAAEVKTSAATLIDIYTLNDLQKNKTRFPAVLSRRSGLIIQPITAVLP
jgi:hypothetical protein